MVASVTDLVCFPSENFYNENVNRLEYKKACGGGE